MTSRLKPFPWRRGQLLGARAPSQRCDMGQSTVRLVSGIADWLLVRVREGKSRLDVGMKLTRENCASCQQHSPPVDVRGEVCGDARVLLLRGHVLRPQHPSSRPCSSVPS